MISKNIEKFLLSENAADTNVNSLEPDADLLELGVIDSLGILKLVSFLEKSYGINVSDEDIVPENFQKLSSIVHFVEKKLQNK